MHLSPLILFPSTPILNLLSFMEPSPKVQESIIMWLHDNTPVNPMENWQMLICSLQGSWIYKGGLFVGRPRVGCEAEFNEKVGGSPRLFYSSLPTHYFSFWGNLYLLKVAKLGATARRGKRSWEFTMSALQPYLPVCFFVPLPPATRKCTQAELWPGCGMLFVLSRVLKPCTCKAYLKRRKQESRNWDRRMIQRMTKKPILRTSSRSSVQCVYVRSH